MKTIKKTSFVLSSLIALASCGAGASSVSSSDVYCEVKFNYEGYETQIVKYGEKATKPVDPVKEPSGDTSYDFVAWFYNDMVWNFDDPVEESMTLEAKFKKQSREFVITFKNEDEVLQTSRLKYQEMPSYQGKTPTKNPVGDERYVFTGWDHEITPAVKNDTYYAVFESVSSKIIFVDIDEEYFPYDDRVKRYLSAEDPDVHNYVSSTSANKDIVIKWENGFKNVTDVKAEYSLNADFSDAKVMTLDKKATSVSLNNLYKDSTYYLRVTVTNDTGEHSATTSFKTTDLGPRVISVDGVCNARDLGGYMTESGKKTKQGIAYRGGCLLLSTDIYTNQITEIGKKTMSEDLGIKAEFDLRTADENREKGIYISPIPGASLTYFGLGGYEAAFGNKEQYRNLFKAMANRDNYPFYVHCTGGADRTGTVSFLYNALLGVSLTDLIHDYEFTSFSIYGERNSRPGTSYNFSGFYEQLLKYEGEKLSDKVESYLLWLGLTKTDINSIKSIAFGE